MKNMGVFIISVFLIILVIIITLTEFGANLFTSFLILFLIAFFVGKIILICSDYNNDNHKNNSNSNSYSTSATSEFIREQRNKMNRKYTNGLTLRQYILKRDNYTCQKCGNSAMREPNLLLEVDHIVPVSKWGRSVPENLQTLCWKCNRSKSNK